MAKKPSNLARGISPISGALIESLNKLGTAVEQMAASSGTPPLGVTALGTQLAREIDHRFSIANTRLSALAGHSGTVTIAEQKRASSGVRPAAMDVQGGTVTGVGTPTLGSDAINLDYFRRFLDCNWFEQMAEDCLEGGSIAAGTVPPVPTNEIVHTMWGYTYEIPNFTDTVDGDPGVSESDQGSFWQFIVPVTTKVDRVSFMISQGLPPISAGPISFGIYQFDTATTATRKAVSETLEANGAAVGPHTLALDSRVTLDPGMYAVSYVAPCFDVVCINANTPVWDMINALWEPFHRYGIFALEAGTHPVTLNTSNVLQGAPDPNSNFFPYTQPVPLSYFDDSGEFGSAVIS